MLKDLMESAVDYSQLEEELEEHGNELKAILDRLVILSESPSTEWFDLTKELDVVLKQFEAAKRGLGLVNKLQPGESRARHASRIMGNMNRIRAGIRRIERELEKYH